MCRCRLLLLSLFLLVVQSTGAQSVRSVDIDVSLFRDGSASVCEEWDVTVIQGTEWYLVRDNLGDIAISDLAVTDESGRSYIDEGLWDVDRPLEQKKGRCGIVRRGDGCEICWGLGSYGDHIYKVSYTMSNVVKSLDEADMLHVQFISPGLSSLPQRARISIGFAQDVEAQMDTINTRVWGFGYRGDIYVNDGVIEATTSEPFSKRSSMIVLAKFEKGLFDSQSTVNESFAEHLDKALKGSDYTDDEPRWKRMLCIALGLIGAAGIFVFLGVASARRRNRRMFGVDKLSEIGWSRDVPFGGDVYPSYQVLNKIGKAKSNNIASSLILEMIRDGFINITKDAKGRVELSFNDSKSRSSLYPSARELYDMMRDASGSDNILQHKEFSRWSSKHQERIVKWCSTVEADAVESLSKGGYSASDRYNDKGQSEARKVIGLKKFLTETTLIAERSTPEVILWREYMIFASLYGIADKVAKELRDINPQVFEEAMSCDVATSTRVLYLSSHIGNNITSAVVNATVGRSGGAGGLSSFGGGGGFSGGGHGGGCR